MHCSCFQTSKQAQPPFLTRFSASLNGIQRTCKIHGCLGEGPESKTQPCLREWRHNLTRWLVPSFLAFITIMVPLPDLLTCGDDPKSLTQPAKNEVYSSGMICSLMIILHNQFCHPVSARQNDWASVVVRKELCEPQTPVTPDDAIFVYARVKLDQLVFLWYRLTQAQSCVLFKECFTLC